MTRHGDVAGQQQVHGLIEEVVALISDADLAVAAMSLHLCCTLLQRHPASARDLSASALPPSMALLQSQLLQVALLICCSTRAAGCSAPQCTVGVHLQPRQASWLIRVVRAEPCCQVHAPVSR